MRIGLDLDGVLADFNTAFISLIKQQLDITLPPPDDTYPHVWAYHREGGVTKEQDTVLWEKIRNTDFWNRLMPYPETVTLLRYTNMMRWGGDGIYFITTRPGQNAKYHTEQWLDRWGAQQPTVLIAGDEAAKGQLAQGLKLDAFIDDKPENCFEVSKATRKTEALGINADVFSYPCQTFLLDRPYNRSQAHRDLCEQHKVTRVYSVVDTLHDLSKEKSELPKAA